MLRIPTCTQNFIQISSKVSSLHMCEVAHPQFTRLFFPFFLSHMSSTTAKAPILLMHNVMYNVLSSLAACGRLGAATVAAA